MRIFINSNCPQEQIFLFDMLATATGLYKMADVVLDASESNNIVYPLNTTFTLLLGSSSGGIDGESLPVGLADFYKKGQIIGVCLKDECKEFVRFSLNQFYPLDTFSALNLKKEIKDENISRNDVLILREFLKLGVTQPFYVKIPHHSEVLVLNEEGVLSYTDNESLELTAKNLNDFIEYSREQEKLSDNRCSELFDMLNNNITPVYFDSNIDIFNEVVTPELMVDYKKRFNEYLKGIANDKDKKKYLGFNKNALLLYDIIESNQELFDALYKE